MLTASIAGYAPTTWVGVSGSNLTVPIRAVARPTEPTATVTGTIDLWGALPLATGNHQLLAIVMASAPPGSDDVEEIGQGTRSVHMLRGSATANVPANVCLRTTLIDDCHWQLATRPGPQAHFAVIIDQDTNGTSDPLDDTNTVIAYAVKTGVAPIAGSVSTGEVLERIADRDLQDFSAAFPILPPEMAQLAAFPILNLGKAGRITIAVPALDFRHPTTRVPKPVGRLAGMTYDLDARAQSANAEIDPTTESWVRDAKVSDTVAVPDWLPPPSGVSATRGIYGFTAVPGATLHAAELQNASSGARLWSVTIFDGSTSFTLPDLAPDPLPPGTVKLQVSALAIPGINLEAIALHDAMQKRTARSTAALTFRR